MRARTLMMSLPIMAVAAGGLMAAQRGGAPAPSPAMVAAGHVAFAQCSICHATIAGKNGLGPSVAGVVGRRIAGVLGFAYSPALKAKKGVWTREQIDAFIAAPQKAVPGTRMAYPGQPDAGKRAAITAYLSTLK